VPACRLSDRRPADLREEWFTGKRAVGVSAGASAPELLVQQVIEHLRRWAGRRRARFIGREERFLRLLRELRRESEKPV